jgi:HEAT repeat protein
MKDGWEKPHNAVIYALMKMDEHQLLESMIKALNDSDTNVRWTAAEILGKLGEPQAVEPLIQALKDDHWLVRQAAAHSLEKMSGPQVLEPMIRALKGNDKNLHLIAIKALEKLGGIQLIEPMIQAIKYKNKVVGHAALEVLEMILPGMEVKSSYRDPLEEPPGEMVKRRWVRVSRILALFLLLSMAAVGAVLLGAAGDVLKEIWKQDIQNFAKSHPIWSVILIIAGLGAVLGLVDWLKKHVEE